MKPRYARRSITTHHQHNSCSTPPQPARYSPRNGIRYQPLQATGINPLELGGCYVVGFIMVLSLVPLTARLLLCCVSS
jgi:hypothetical protein